MTLNSHYSRRIHFFEKYKCNIWLFLFKKWNSVENVRFHSMNKNNIMASWDMDFMYFQNDKCWLITDNHEWQTFYQCIQNSMGLLRNIFHFRGPWVNEGFGTADTQPPGHPRPGPLPGPQIRPPTHRPLVPRQKWNPPPWSPWVLTAPDRTPTATSRGHLSPGWALWGALGEAGAASGPESCQPGLRARGWDWGALAGPGRARSGACLFSQGARVIARPALDAFLGRAGSEWAGRVLLNGLNGQDTGGGKYTQFEGISDTEALLAWHTSVPSFWSFSPTPTLDKCPQTSTREKCEDKWKFTK